MQLNLERVDSGGLELALGPDADAAHRISLGATKGLRGSLWQQGELIRLTEAAAESLIVALLQLTFKTFTVTLRTEGAISQLSGDYERGARQTELHLAARAVRAPRLSAQFERFQLRGALQAEDVRIDVSGAVGRISAKRLELSGLELASAVALQVERLIAKDVDIFWDTHGYEVRVSELGVPKAEVELDLSEAFRSSVAANPEEEPTRTTAGAWLLDWSVLDGVSGSVDVDAFVEMKVPVLGSRQAKHPFRVSIQAGSVNYRELEDNLSTLENAVLDFAVRQEALVLERGIPLLPTRGKGKKLVTWPLSPDDLALAMQDRVRLAVLPQWKLAPAEGPDQKTEEQARSESDSPSVALRQLSFVDLQALLRLQASESSTTPIQGLSFEELLLQGTVHHLAEGDPRPGEITGSLRGLNARVLGLPIGASRLDVGSLGVAQITQLRAPFRGLRPQRFSAVLADLRAASVRVGNRRF